MKFHMGGGLEFFMPFGIVSIFLFQKLVFLEQKQKNASFVFALKK